MERFKVLTAVAFVSVVTVTALDEDKARSAFHQDAPKTEELKREQKVWACAVMCMDARCHKHQPVENYLEKHHKIYFTDPITEGGPDKTLAENPPSGLEKAIVENTKKRIWISVHHHGSKIVAIVGHFDCAANPGNKEMHVKHLRAAKKTVESFNLGVEVILLWIDQDFKKAERVY